MKKVLAVLMTLVLAVTLCVPSFAANDDTTAPTDEITAVIEEILGSILGSDGTVGVDAVLQALSGLLGGSVNPDAIPDLSQPVANQVVNALAAAGMTKADMQATFDQMLADGQISETTYGNLMTAVEALPDDGSQGGGIIDDAQAQEIAGQILSALNSLGVTNDQIIEALDSMYANGTLPENVYNALIEQINAAENTTAAEGDGEGGLGGLLGGVGDFFGGIFDTIGGLLGFGGGEGGDDSGNTTPENAGEYGGSDPTGDTVVFAVVGVAAVAGAALLLTRKKKADK